MRRVNRWERSEAGPFDEAGAAARLGTEPPVMTTPRFIVRPGSDVLLNSFYLLGLTRRGRVLFRPDDLPPVAPHRLAFVAENDSHVKVVVCALDNPGFDEAALDWCDVYAKVNVDRELIPDSSAEKVRSLGPHFPVKLWSLTIASLKSAVHYAKAHGRVGNRKEHFANYVRQWRYRVPEDAFTPAKSDADYVFFSSRLWKKEKIANDLRARFVEVCRQMRGLEFDGGFIPRTKGDVPGYEHLLQSRQKPVPLAEYLAKTRRSAVVFNTPAVLDCHSWKFGEYLALGKAIVSTRLVRDLPTPLVHGENIHFVEGSFDSIKEAVGLICRDDDYRRRLEIGARNYYDEFLKPERVINRILS